MDVSLPARLLVLTGPIASGKNATAEALVRRTSARGCRVVLADVDDVASMVGPPGAAAGGLWSSAHEAHGALVGQWVRSPVDLVVAVGPVYSADEQHALTRHLPGSTPVDWVVLDAPVDVTLARAAADPARGVSRRPDFHRTAHARFRALLPGIPHGLLLDSSAASAEDLAAAVEQHLAL